MDALTPMLANRRIHNTTARVVDGQPEIIMTFKYGNSHTRTLALRQGDCFVITVTPTNPNPDTTYILNVIDFVFTETTRTVTGIICKLVYSISLGDTRTYYLPIDRIAHNMIETIICPSGTTGEDEGPIRPSYMPRGNIGATSNTIATTNGNSGSSRRKSRKSKATRKSRRQASKLS